MISKSYILENLRSLEFRYRRARSAKEALFCSKLAILELCGWIEESMDDVVRRCATRHLEVQTNRDFCESQIIQRNFGFNYERNFRTMLIGLLGLVAVESLEKKVDQAKYASMKATLSSLKTVRDSEAHTHLKSARTLNAPSVTMSQFKTLYEGLTEFERKIKLMKL